MVLVAGNKEVERDELDWLGGPAAAPIVTFQYLKIVLLGGHNRGRLFPPVQAQNSMFLCFK
jgi:hypothetical protein